MSVISKLGAGSGWSIEYWTDLEGNINYFESLLCLSDALYKDSEGNLQLREKCYFVHGGDTVDKGEGDIRVTKLFVGLKQRYPDRVFLLLGNRDLNKLRFTAELAPGEIGNEKDIYWDKKCKPYTNYCDENKLDPKSQISTLKWMLFCTMGCQTTFETRKLELEILSGKENVTDQEVFDSFVQSVDPNSNDPWMLNLIRLGSLMVVIGNCLFVHGALSPSTIGRVPGTSERYDTLHDWARALNSWKDDQVHSFESGTQRFTSQRNSQGHRERDAKDLLDYGVPGGADGTTVVYQSWLENGNCKLPDDQVVEYLLRNGIMRIATGHVPHGDCPSVIRHPSDLTVFLCDTSYSDMSATKTPNPANNRGAAASTLTFTKTSSKVQGILANGNPHGYTLAVKSSEEVMPDGLVGRRLRDNSWVKTITLDGVALVAKGEGFKLDIKRFVPAEVVPLLASGSEFGPSYLRRFIHGRWRVATAVLAAAVVGGVYQSMQSDR